MILRSVYKLQCRRTRPWLQAVARRLRPGTNPGKAAANRSWRCACGCFPSFTPSIPGATRPALCAHRSSSLHSHSAARSGHALPTEKGRGSGRRCRELPRGIPACVSGPTPTPSQETVGPEKRVLVSVFLFCRMLLPQCIWGMYKDRSIL